MCSVHRLLGIAFAIVGSVACDTPSSATDLYTQGPPKVRQIRMWETIKSGTDFTEQRVFGFGTHPMADAKVVHSVSSASPLSVNNSPPDFRIIMSELLRGNRLEEIACRFAVDDDAYAQVPDGTTP